MSQFESIWAVPDASVAAGRIPGYVGAVRIGGRVEIHAIGTQDVDPASVPMSEETLFRIASITKPMGAALTLNLVQDGFLTLDDPVARWLPEVEKVRVLLTPDAPLDQTVEAVRPITVRHLLTMTAGWGVVMQSSPLQAAMMELGVFPSPLIPPMSGDEFVARVAGLPLAFQPGEGWLYDTPIDVLGVVLARATGTPLSELLAERVTGPLGMHSTTFGSPEISRLATAYQPSGEGLAVLDPPDGVFSGPPPFEELSSGLVSTAPDVLRFFTAMADGGGPVLNAQSLALMRADALTPAQRAQARPIVGSGRSWGLGTAIDIAASEPWMAPGRWGWDGGTGTTGGAYPDGTAAVLLTQRLMTGPLDGFDDFWAAVALAA